MAIHVTCGTAGAYSQRRSTLPVERAELYWSETLSAPGTTTNVVPSVPAGSFASAILCVAAIDVAAWVAIGPSPNASTNPRRFVTVGRDVQLEAQPGDKVAWVAVS